MKNILLVLIIFVIIGCTSTKYQPLGRTGGYENTQLDENIFEVTFWGNGYTSSQRVRDFAMLQSAELTVQNGYTYFVPINENTSSTQHTVVTPQTSTTNTNISGSANTFGNTTYGNAYGTSNTTTYGGQQMIFNKPTTRMRIICLKNKPNDVLSYNAYFIIKSIKNKYDIK
jgi:hypothetical protein